MQSDNAAARSASWASLAGGLGAVLVPKCPACFAAYGSGLAALGLSPAPQRQVMEPLLVVAVMLSFGLVLALSVRRRDFITPVVSAAGALLVLGGRLALDLPAVTASGAALLVAGAIANSARCRGLLRPRHRGSSLQASTPNIGRGDVSASYRRGSASPWIPSRSTRLESHRGEGKRL